MALVASAGSVASPALLVMAATATSGTPSSVSASKKSISHVSSCFAKLALRSSLWYGAYTHFAQAVSDDFAVGIGTFAPSVSMAADSSAAVLADGMPLHKQSNACRVECTRTP